MISVITFVDSFLVELSSVDCRSWGSSTQTVERFSMVSSAHRPDATGILFG